MAVNAAAQISQDVSSVENTADEETVSRQHCGTWEYRPYADVHKPLEDKSKHLRNIQHDDIKEAVQGKEDIMKNLRESKEDIQNVQEDIQSIKQIIQVIKEDMKKNTKESERKVDRRTRQIAGQSEKHILCIICIMVGLLAYFITSYKLDSIEDLYLKTQELHHTSGYTERQCSCCLVLFLFCVFIKLIL